MISKDVISQAGFNVLNSLSPAGAVAPMDCKSPVCLELQEAGLITEVLDQPWTSKLGERLYKLSGFGRQVVLNMAITKQLIREARHKE